MRHGVTWTRTAQAAHTFDAIVIAGVITLGVGGLLAARRDLTVQAAPFSVPLGLLTVLAAVPLWWRRRRPVTMLAVVLACTAVATAVSKPGLFVAQTVAEIALLCYSVGAWTTRRSAAIAFMAVLIAVLIGGTGHRGGNWLAAATDGIAVVALPAVLGYAARTRRSYLAEVESRLETAVRDRDELAGRAVRDERTRIARELHDLVAHHVSLIGVQAGAARTALDRSPELARSAFEMIEASSRSAVREMHQLLDVLSPEGSDSAPRTPQPSLARLPTLIDQWRATGVNIDAAFVGEYNHVPEALSLCSYRIVEEALTNAVRHAPGHAVRVSVTINESMVVIDVTDHGPTTDIRRTSIDGAATSGRGLVGMRERVALFGGTLTTGGLGNKGFQIAATLPYRRR